MPGSGPPRWLSDAVTASVCAGAWGEVATASLKSPPHAQSFLFTCTLKYPGHTSIPTSIGASEARHSASLRAAQPMAQPVKCKANECKGLCTLHSLSSYCECTGLCTLHASRRATSFFIWANRTGILQKLKAWQTADTALSKVENPFQKKSSRAGGRLSPPVPALVEEQSHRGAIQSRRATVVLRVFRAVGVLFRVQCSDSPTVCCLQVTSASHCFSQQGTPR